MLRDKFPQYVRPTDDELAALLANGIIVLDTSALLNLYRYSERTKEDFLGVYEHDRIQPRLWMPHQVAAEFLSNRPNVLLEKHDEVKKLKRALENEVSEALKKAKISIKAVARNSTEHPHIDISGLEENLEQEIRAPLKKVLEQFLDGSDTPTPGQELDDDPLYQRIEELFGARIGDGFDSETIEKIKRGGEIRFQRQVPPGYKDLGKKPDPYGDLVIWEELIERAKSQDSGVLLVLDDRKEDWVAKRGRSTLGPRLELVGEMFDRAKQRFHLYDSARFHRYAKELLEETPRPESIQEAENLNDFVSERESIKEIFSRELAASATHSGIADFSSQLSRDALISARDADIALRNTFLENLSSAASADLLRGALGSANISTEVEQFYKYQPMMGLSTAAVADLREQVGLISPESLLAGIQEQREIAEAAGIIINPQKLLDATRFKLNDLRPLSHGETEDDEEPVSDDDSTEQETE